jgi:hypothetical protein
MMVGRNSEFLGPCVEDSFELTSMHNIIMMSYICTLKHTTAAYSLRDTHREATHGRVRPSISINLDRLKIRLMIKTRSVKRILERILERILGQRSLAVFNGPS